MPSPAPAPLTFRCPRCRVAVEEQGEAYACGACGRRYPVVLGIPDFRVHEDPLIPLDDDYRKGEVLARAAEGRTFAELVAFYWTLPTYPPTPAPLAERFVRHVLTDRERVSTYAEALGTGDRVLDVGCGAGVLLQTIGGRFATAVGVDVGFRWLVVARHGLAEAGLDAQVVCACADHLPFADGAFDTVASVALIEHLSDVRAATAEFARVARPGARLVLWTSNRFTLAREPHVGVWGVGFLPRRWTPAYVRLRTGLAYERKHLLSRFDLARLLPASGFADVRFLLPRIAAPDWRAAAVPARAAVRLYHALRVVPGVRWLLSVVFPALLVLARRGVEGRSA